MIDFAKLRQPFFPDELEWKPQSAGKTGSRFWVRALAYVTNRAIMDRLDEVAGPQAWKNEFRPGVDGGVMCGLSIKIDSEWVTKWDGSENTDIEAVKGGLSGAMKRAAVQWGVGRYLYDLEENFGEVTESGIYGAKTKEGEKFKWNPPKLPDWAIPGSSQTKARGAIPPPGEPVDKPDAQAKLKEVTDFLNKNKPLFNPEQTKVIRIDLEAAGTDGKLLDALKEKAVQFLVKNQESAL